MCFIREIFMGLLFNLVRPKNRRRQGLSGFLVIKCIFKRFICGGDGGGVCGDDQNGEVRQSPVDGETVVFYTVCLLYI